MKKLFIVPGMLVFAIFLGVFTGLLTSAPLAPPVIITTDHSPYYLMRSEANETALIDLTTAGDYAHKDGNAVQIVKANPSESKTNLIGIIACGGADANKTFTMTMYGWKTENGPCERVFVAVFTLGAQSVLKYPHNNTAPSPAKYWADTISITTDYWIKSCSAADASGNNGVAKIYFDTCGFEYFLPIITDADYATGDEAGRVSVFYTGF